MNSMAQQKLLMSRRRFLAAGALIAAPLFLPSRILRREGTIVPNDKIVVGNQRDNSHFLVRKQFQEYNEKH